MKCFPVRRPTEPLQQRGQFLHDNRLRMSRRLARCPRDVEGLACARGSLPTGHVWAGSARVGPTPRRRHTPPAPAAHTPFGHRFPLLTLLPLWNCYLKASGPGPHALSTLAAPPRLSPLWGAAGRLGVPQACIVFPELAAPGAQAKLQGWGFIVPLGDRGPPRPGGRLALSRSGDPRPGQTGAGRPLVSCQGALTAQLCSRLLPARSPSPAPPSGPFPGDMSVGLSPGQSCSQGPGVPLWWVCKQSPGGMGRGLEQEQGLVWASGGG